MNLPDLSSIPVQSMENYRGSLPYARYFKNELILRSISLDSMECGKLFCIYQSEKEKQRFYEHFEDINLSFYDIESYIQSRTTFYEPSAAEKIMMFNKAVKPSTECYSSFAATLKTMLTDVVSRAAVDSCLLLKMLNDAPQPVKEALVKHSTITLEVFLREAKDHEDKQRVRLLFPRPSPENVQERRKEPKILSSPQVMVPKKCFNCQQPGHLRPNCPLKTDLNPTTEAKLLSLAIEKSQFYPNEWNKAPLLFESFNFGPHQLVACIDSGAEINVLPAYMIDAYVNVGIDVRKVSQMVVSGVGKKDVAAVANLLIYSIATQKAVAVDVYFINEMTPLITVQTAHALGLSIDELASHAIDERVKLKQVLDDLYVFDKELANEFLRNKSTFDESNVEPKLEVKIELASNVPSKIFKPYPISDSGRKILSKFLSEEIKLGHIKPIADPIVALPITIEPLKNRVCTDSRWINRFIHGCDLPVPSKEELLIKISQSEYFSTFDFRRAFKLMRINKEFEKFNVISTCYGYYSSDRLQFGIKSASGLFHLMISDLLRPLSKNALWYVDDVLFFGDLDSQRSAIIEFVKICSINGLKFNIHKMQLFKKSVTFLGSLISSNGISVHPSRIAELKNLEKPKSVNEMQRFLGKYVFISKNIENYCEIVNPLYPRKDDENDGYVWSSAREKAFLRLKDATQNYLTLTPPLPGEDLFLYHVPTPESLHVELRNAKDDMIDIYMRTYTSAENNYSELEKELLSISSYINLSLPFIFERNIIWLTTSKMISKMLQTPLDLSSNASSRIQSLLAPLVIFNMECRFSNKLKSERNNVEVKIFAAKIDISSFSDISLTKYLTNGEIRADQSSSVVCLNLFKYFDSLDKKGEYLLSIPKYLREEIELLNVVEGIICIDGKPIISSNLALIVIREIHRQSHSGTVIMVNEASLWYFFKGWSSICARVLDECSLCLRMKAPTHKKTTCWSPALFPRERGHYDICYIDNNPIIMLCDSFSNYVMVKMLKSKSQENLVSFFRPLLEQFPWSILISDNEPSLCGPDLAMLFQEFHVHHVTSIPYFPASNGLVEKYIHIFKTKVKKFMLSSMSLSSSISAAVHAINHFANTKRKISAAQLFYTSYDKKIDYLPPKEVVVPNKMIYFLPKGKLSSTYLAGTLVATLGSRINVVLHEDMKYYVSVDHCHYGYHKYNLDEVLKDVPNLFTTPLEHDDKTLKLLDHDHVDDDAFLYNQRELFNKECLENSIKSMKELLELIRKSKHKNFLFIDGSIKNGHGVGIYGLLHGIPVFISKRGYLRGRVTSPRMEVEALMECMKLLQSKGVGEADIFSDNSYVVNSVNQGWAKLWLSEEGKRNSRNKVPAHINQWKSIMEIHHPNYKIYHVQGHQLEPHNVADLLAKGESINELLESIKKYNDPDELFPTSEKVPPLQLNLPAPE